MKTRVVSVSALCFSLLVGCQQSVDDLVVNENYPISIEASIGDAGGGRYLATTLDDAVFSNGDEIGLAYQVGEDAATDFVKWTFNGRDWNQNGSSMTWKNKDEEHIFYAFYPYGNNDANTTLEQVKMPLLTGQNGTMASVAERDFLVATKTQSYSDGGEVYFTGVENAFKHVSSLVVLKLMNAGDLVAATINSISLTGANLVAASTYSFTAIDNKVSLVDGGNDDVMIANLENGVMEEDDEYIEFYFVVNSGTVDLSAVTLSITYTSVGGGVYTATKQGLNQGNDDEKYERGHFYNYGITITTDKTLLISGYEIDEWVEGGSIDDITINSEKQNQNP